jgi:hypothetical protein
VEGQPEVFYVESQVEALIPQLRRRNALGFDIYITPIDPDHHYLVIDDMRSGASQLLASLGHQPCLVQSSSAGNEQAVLKVTKADRLDEQKLANKLVQQLNQEHGDPRFSGVVHPFRMAGFSNKKPGRESAFTRILEAGHRLCHKAADLLQQLRQAADGLVVNAGQDPTLFAGEVTVLDLRAGDCVKGGRSPAKRTLDAVARPLTLTAREPGRACVAWLPSPSGGEDSWCSAAGPYT